jgi:type IV pilus assembly protein PilB
MLNRLQQAKVLPPNVMMSLRKSTGEEVHAFAEQAIREGHVSRQLLGSLLGEEIGHTYVSTRNTLIQPVLAKQIGPDLARRHQAIPLYKLGGTATVAMANPLDEAAVSAIGRSLSCPISPVFSLADEIEGAIRIHFESSQAIEDAVLTLDLQKMAGAEMDARAVQALIESHQIVALGESIIILALKERASDIHLEPKRHELILRFRIDGKLVDRLRFPAALAKVLTSRFKVMSALDITERRRPQDGRIAFGLPGMNFDLRVSTLPVMHGEKIVMRILGPSLGGVVLDLKRMQFSRDVLASLTRALDQPSGIVFVTGPTGSGKTTTLHAALAYLDSREDNIITIEDPVEIEAPTLNQVVINEAIGAGFAAALRSVLRQDPDVILLGEVRDVETARIATQAALTGHLVLTTLHTNDAVLAIPRLLDMGVEPFTLAPAVLGVLAQRLVRRICPDCKVAHALTRDELDPSLVVGEGQAIPSFFKGTGCEACGGTGFRGRVAVHEFLRVSSALRDAILARESPSRMRAIARAEGFRTMREDGVRKALLGLTTLTEVFDATAGDDA